MSGLLNWSAKKEGQTIRLEARHQGMELSLELDPRKPSSFTEQNGLSRKGARKKDRPPTISSYTDLATQGIDEDPASVDPIRCSRQKLVRS